MEIKNKRVLVVGIARSGVAVARFLVEKGAMVTLTDSKTSEQLRETLRELPAGKVEVMAGVYPKVTAGDFDLLVVSPGVPLTVAPVRQALAAGVPVLSELELAYRFAVTPVVAITGTNGKTTTTTLTGEIFKAAGRRTCVGGNIGLPLVLEVEKYGPEDIIVAEVSSFQLESIHDFKPRVAAILNFTPDHLDRHGTMENYMAAKARVFENQDRRDYTILNYDDPEVRKLAGKTAGQVIFFSRQHKLDTGVFVQNGHITAVTGENREIICPVQEVGIRGAHNLENALAATAATYVMGVGGDTIGQVLRTFPGVTHRMEYVAEINGVKYVNDSKGTNPDAAIKALDAYDEPIVLIAGGRSKGSDFGEFAARVQKKARALVVVGECAEELAAAVRGTGFNRIRRAADFEDAVHLAAREARPGDIVLLSPACASWDMFKSFEERGDLFKAVVGSLEKSGHS
jgi:UDP-N-acetylmuramoylalanine--D-glutamate ligase